ncbi:MAG: ABC transporter substrate-binding protein [Thermodesulfobacteriota bacterium]
MRFLWKIAAAGLCLLLAMAMTDRCAVAAPVEPLAVVRQGVNEIIAILQDKKLAGAAQKEERRKRASVVVGGYFDFEEMSMRALARYWKERTPDERKHFVGLFRQLLERTYMDKVDNYCRELDASCTDKVVLFKRQEQQGDKAVVYTVFLRNNVETPVEYKLKSESGRWRVYDVVIEGVSLVRNYRTQFESILAKEPFSSLVAKMEEKIRKGESMEDAKK